MIHELDRLIGSKIRVARVLRGKSQTEIAKALNVTFQQVQKYENGKNKVSARNLKVISEVTKKPISWFFESEENIISPEILESKQITSDLIRAFLNINNIHQQKRILSVIQSMGK